MQATSGPVALARVTHDRQARECYPAAVWTELRAHAKAALTMLRPLRQGDVRGEGDIVKGLRSAAGEGLKRERVTCEAPQHLSDEAIPYLVLRRRDGEGETPLVPRLTSALADRGPIRPARPLCWFVSYRVKPQSIDAGFDNMEKGKPFVHDVLEHLHARLPQGGHGRVTPENLPRARSRSCCTGLLTRPGRARAGKARHGGPLVPLSPGGGAPGGRRSLPQRRAFFARVRGRSPPFAPRYLSSPSTSSRSSMPVGRLAGASTAWTWTPRIVPW